MSRSSTACTPETTSIAWARGRECVLTQSCECSEASTNHGTLSLAYLVREYDRRNVELSALSRLGLKPGPRLRAVEDQSVPNDEPVETDAGIGPRSPSAVVLLPEAGPILVPARALHQGRSAVTAGLDGSEETMNEIEASLPPQVAERVVGKRRFDLHRGEDELVDDVYQAYFEEEREQEQRLWDRIKGEYRRHSLAAVGPTDVLAAFEQGRVEELIVTRDAQIAGTQCRDCEALVHRTPETCQSCGSNSVFRLDLVDELTKRAELTGAHTEFSDELPGLVKAGHVAALLRW